MSNEVHISFTPQEVDVNINGQSANFEINRSERIPAPGPGVPPGGTPGQIIKKASDEDYDTEWVDCPSIAPGTHESGTAVIGGVLNENGASGNYSLAFGRGNTATKGGSLAFGRNNSATGSYSAAVGYGNTALASSAHAEGDSTTASGQMAHSEGQGTTASGQDSHAEGYFTTASGELAHSEGRETTASGRSSHTEGQYTIATHRSQHAFGEYNEADPSVDGPTVKGNYIEIVGNGTADNARSNARTLDWSGNEVLAGKLTVGAEPTNDMDVSTKKYVDDQRIAGGEKGQLLGKKSATDYDTEWTAPYIPYGSVDGTSTSTAFTATLPGITKYFHGLHICLKNGVVTSASGFTININGLGAKPVYNNMAAASAETTIFNVNYTLEFIYDENRVNGGCWVCYRGYNSDTNTIGYQIRTNNTILKTSDTCRYYKIFFTSADGHKWVPASADQTNNATSARAVNQRPIDPFGRIVYTSATTKYSADGDVAATSIWQQYNLTLGYSFNRTGAALTLTSKAPVYVKCAPQTDGSAIMDSATPIVQSLPSTNDGKIYIFLGVATSATQVELALQHPVYWYNGTGIRIWTGGA